MSNNKHLLPHVVSEGQELRSSLAESFSLSSLMRLQSRSWLGLWLPWWLRRICLQYRRPRFNPWVRKIPWRREWQPTPVFLPGESHGQRSLVGDSPWGCRVGHDWETKHSTLRYLKVWLGLKDLLLSSLMWLSARPYSCAVFPHMAVINFFQKDKHMRKYKTGVRKS